MNVLHIINEAFNERCKIVFNPRNAFYISKIDGKVNSDVLPQRDTIINANTLLYLGRNNYSEDNMKKIAMIKEKQKAFYMDDDIYLRKYN